MAALCPKGTLYKRAQWEHFLVAFTVPNGHNIPVMHLSHYLAKHKITQEAFADLIKVDRSTVARLCLGTRRPGLGTMQKIHKVTGGKVTLNDFAAEGRAQ